MATEWASACRLAKGLGYRSRSVPETEWASTCRLAKAMVWATASKYRLVKAMVCLKALESAYPTALV
jgi:hypothetical protein